MMSYVMTSAPDVYLTLMPPKGEMISHWFNFIQHDPHLRYGLHLHGGQVITMIFYD